MKILVEAGVDPAIEDEVVERFHQALADDRQAVILYTVFVNVAAAMPDAAKLLESARMDVARIQARNQSAGSA